MKKHIWAWTVGGALFVMIIGVWVWLLPGAIKRAGGLHDSSVSAILSVFGAAKSSLSPDLVKAKAQFDSNLKQAGQAISAQAAEAAAIENLKNKIVQKSMIKAADVAPAPGLPAPAPKPPVKK